MNEQYVCPENTFRSYLAPVMKSYMEYEVNIRGCSPDSFLARLSQFDRYCQTHPEPEICLKQETVMGYLAEKEVNCTRNLEHIESSLRVFARYMVSVLGNEQVYVLPKLLRNVKSNFIPYVFSTEEIRRLFHAADTYQPGIWKSTIPNLANCARCMVKALYCTGMRVSEVCYLKTHEVDMENRLIYINRAKNDKHRIVTISSSLLKEMERYLADSEGCRLSGVYFFDSGSTSREGRVTSDAVYEHFRRYLRIAGIEHKGKGFGPRLHDLRVTFAVHSLRKLTAQAEDVNAALTWLSAYMGHKSIAETQSYLWMNGELYQDVQARMSDYTPFVASIFEEKAGDSDD